MDFLKHKKQYFVLIDESGTLPDVRDRFVTITGVGLREMKKGKNLISQTLKSLRREKNKIKEVKFYYAGDRTKRRVLSGMVSAEFEIFTVIIDKKGRKISDTPENFALLAGELISEINLWNRERSLKIIIDRHFFKKDDERNFNKFLEKNIKRNVSFSIQHIDSQQNFIVNLADFAAGAILAKYNKNNFQFYDIIKESILLEKIINWPELKRKSLEYKKIP